MDQLQKWRKQVNVIDRVLIRTLGKRFNITGKIQTFKKKNGLPTKHADRETDILKKLSMEIKKQHLPMVLLKKLYKIIFNYSRGQY